MMWYTHIITALLVLGAIKLSPALIALGALATLLPDIDNPNSLIGRVLFPVSHFLSKRYNHRTITHSFLAMLIITAITGLTFNLQIILAVAIGYFLHLFLDMFNPTGVPLLYPNTNYFMLFGGPVEAGSLKEIALFGFLFFIASLLGAFSFYKLSPIYLFKTIFADSSAVHVDEWKSMQKSNLVQAQITGYWSYSKMPANLTGTVTDGDKSVLYILYNNSIFSVSSEEPASIIPEKIELKKIKESSWMEVVYEQKTYQNYSEFLNNLKPQSLLSGKIYFYNQIGSEQKFDLEQVQINRPEGFAPIKVANSNELEFRRAPDSFFRKISCCVPAGLMKTGVMSIVI